jgi:glycosyltransferase involved in cell wall biosynthesis
MALTHFCHVFSSFDPGGAEVRTVTLMNALGAGVKHTIIAADGKYGAADRIQERVPVDLVPPPPGKGTLWYGLPMARTVRALRPDLLLTYNWGAIDGLIGGLLASVCPVLHAEDGFGLDEARKLKRRRVLTRRLVLRHVFGTIVPSRVLVEIARSQYRLPDEKILHIPNGVDHSRFRPDRDSHWRRQHGIPDDAVLCGTVAGLRAEKNLDLLIAAFGRARRPSLWLAIAGDGPCRARLERVAQHLEAAPRVIFAGPLPDPAPFYRSLDLFTLSSFTEQMPISLLEAMATGLPVLATDVGDIREMLGPSSVTIDTLVPSGDVDTYTSALMALADNPVRRRQLGEQNHERCLSLYTQERMIGAYRETYEHAMGHPL